MRFFLRFPQNKSKALTFSYDDGVRQDGRFMELLNKYGLKCTFNINMGSLGADKNSGRFSKEELVEAYKGHELATHGYQHPFFSALPDNMVTYEIARDRYELEQVTGEIIRGHAYAFGDTSDKAVEILDNTGIVYARTTRATNRFDIPKDWLRLDPTCHHSSVEMFNLIEKFFAPDDRYHRPRLFYIWGHTYEFDNNVERNNWDYADEFLSKLSGHEDEVWYATNIEIYDYVKAYNSLIFSMDGTVVCNPTCTDVWMVDSTYPDKEIKIPAGGCYRF